jgi:hypothetical protein
MYYDSPGPGGEGSYCARAWDEAALTEAMIAERRTRPDVTTDSPVLRGRIDLTGSALNVAQTPLGFWPEAAYSLRRATMGSKRNQLPRVGHRPPARAHGRSMRGAYHNGPESDTGFGQCAYRGRMLRPHAQPAERRQRRSAEGVRTPDLWVILGATEIGRPSRSIAPV